MYEQPPDRPYSSYADMPLFEDAVQEVNYTPPPTTAPPTATPNSTTPTTNTPSAPTANPTDMETEDDIQVPSGVPAGTTMTGGANTAPGGKQGTMNPQVQNRNFSNAMNKYNVGYQETAVLFHPPTRNLFPDTFTITHSTLFNFTWANPVSQYFNEPNGTFGLRLNSPILPLIGTVVTTAANTQWAPGIHLTTSSSGLITTPNPLTPFVIATTYARRSTATNLVPMHKLYKQYTCLESRYRITIKNPSQLTTSEIDAYCFQEAYSTNGTTRCPAMTQSINSYDAWNWDNMKRKRLGYTQANVDTNAPSTGPISLVYEGAWRPNQVPHEPAADPDYQTWQATTIDVRTSPSVPANGVVEQVSVFGMPCIEKPYLAAGQVFGYNVTVEMEWDCQYKDLRNNYRYLHQDVTDVDLNLPEDILGANI